jgi:hypothetical protein
MTCAARCVLALAGGAALMLASATPCGAQQKETIYKSVKPEQIEEVLQKLNITFKKSQPKNLQGVYDFDFKRNKFNYRFTLANFGKQLWLSVAFPKATLEQINAYNQNAKFSRAVLDKVGEQEITFVEAQIDAGGGVTTDMILQFIRRFDEDVIRFDAHLKKG